MIAPAAQLVLSSRSHCWPTVAVTDGNLDREASAIGEFHQRVEREPADPTFKKLVEPGLGDTKPVGRFPLCDLPPLHLAGDGNHDICSPPVNPSPAADGIPAAEGIQEQTG